MSKKFNILAALTALSVSTVGAIVPTFADGTTTYQVSDVVPLHAPFAEDVMSQCGAYANTNTYRNCLNNVIANYRDMYGGQFESMYQLDFNGRMLVTGINPVAGTVRFYTDETKGFQNTAFTFENLVIFWADSSAVKKPAWNEPVGWEFVDAYLETGEIPQGYHVLYSGKRGEEGWITPNTEIRISYDQDSNETEKFIFSNPNKYIHVYGYDTLGNRHLENNYLGWCIDSGLLDGNECRLEYTYNGTNASSNYVQGEATPEDAMIVALKRALKEKAEAEAALAQYESILAETQTALFTTEIALSNAIARAETAENDYVELVSRIAEMNVAIAEYENAIAVYEAAITEAEANLTSAEIALREAEARANAASVAADAAEARATEAETRANEIEAATSAELATAREAVARANQAVAEARALEAEARSSEAEAIRAKELAEGLVAKAEKEVADAKEAVSEAERAATEAKESAKKAQEGLEQAKKNAEESIAESEAKAKEAIAYAETLAANPNMVTVYKTIEKLVKDNFSEVSSATDATAEINEQKSESEKTLDDYVELPTVGNKEETTFPWWLIVFVFTGIALILWWFIPNSRRRGE